MGRFAQVLLMLMAASVGAASYSAEVSQTELETTEAVYTEEALAEFWRLSLEEWQTYRTLMEGPRGIWSPSLDPITVLGIHAETEAERRRYAELLVMIEFERVEQELLFQRAYDEAARRLFPTLPRVTTASSEQPILLSPSVERIAYFGSIDPEKCPTCEREFTALLKRHAGAGAPVLDVFLADAVDDEAIRAWARAQGVGSDELGARRITLNHAQDSVFGSEAQDLIRPRLLQRLDGQWLPMTESK